MAKSTPRSDLAKRLHSLGLRRSVADKAAGAADQARKNPPKAVKSLVNQLRELTGEIETRVTGGSGKSRTATAKRSTTSKARKPKRSTKPKPKPKRGAGSKPRNAGKAASKTSASR